MKHSLITLAVAASLSGCAGMQQLGTDAVVGLAGEAVDALTGPDTDYKNYLSACNAQVRAQAKALEEQNQALAKALTSTNEKIQFGALILVAATNNTGPKIGCYVERKKGFLEGGNAAEWAWRIYKENRDQARFQKRLESDEKLGIRRIDATLESQRVNNDLLTTLSGDKLELQQDARGVTPSEE